METFARGEEAHKGALALTGRRPRGDASASSANPRPTIRRTRPAGAAAAAAAAAAVDGPGTCTPGPSSARPLACGSGANWRSIRHAAPWRWRLTATTASPSARRRRRRRLAPRPLAGGLFAPRTMGRGGPLLDKPPGEAPFGPLRGAFRVVVPPSPPPLPRFRALDGSSSPPLHAASSSSEPRVATGAGRTSRAPVGGGRGRRRTRAARNADEQHGTRTSRRPPRRRSVYAGTELRRSTRAPAGRTARSRRIGPDRGRDLPIGPDRVHAQYSQGRTTPGRARGFPNRGAASRRSKPGARTTRGRGPPRALRLGPPDPPRRCRRRRRLGLPPSRRRLGRHPSYRCERYAALPDHAHFSEGDTSAIHDFCGVSRVIYVAVASQLL
jgi:hypothetical protein